jgi:GAF domain-containing protein
VLQVISSSPGEIQPVFAAMLEKAVQICDATFGNIFRWDGEAFHLMAAHMTPPPFAKTRELSPIRPSPTTLFGRLVATKSVVHTADLAAEKQYVEERRPTYVEAVELGGIRAFLVVPMLKSDELIGAIGLFRHEVRPFTDKQIELVKGFAAQAVIAIENARLLNELRQRTDDLSQRTTDLTEALEQQTATSEVLQVVSSSPGDLRPVFATMLEKAVRICDAKFGTLYLFEDGRLRLVAAQQAPAFVEARSGSAFEPASGGVFDETIRTKRTVQIADLAATKSYFERHPTAVEAVELGGIRTIVGVPMLKDEKLIGIITIVRQEVRPFADKQIALVTNFAAQAVIAIENARLLNELRQRTDDLTERTADLTEALEQQTATADVLQVISSSPGDLGPIFRTMLEKAVRICDASFGNVQRWDGDALQLVASHNTPSVFADARQSPYRPDPALWFSRVLTTKKAVQITDAASEKAYLEKRNPLFVAAVELGGVRTCLLVPMLMDNEPTGVFSLYRQEVRHFTNKQIALVTNFAAQAVIAIENARLLNELRQRTDDLTKSLEDLRTTQDPSCKRRNLLPLASSPQALPTRSRTHSILSTISLGFLLN